MNKISRVITGGLIVLASILLIVLVGILNRDYFSIVFGLFFLCIGLAILFNKKEDDIEQIKKGNK